MDEILLIILQTVTTAGLTAYATVKVNETKLKFLSRDLNEIKSTISKFEEKINNNENDIIRIKTKLNLH